MSCFVLLPVWVAIKATLEILLCAIFYAFLFFRADWFYPHFIPELMFIQNGLADLNALPSVAAAD